MNTPTFSFRALCRKPILGTLPADCASITSGAARRLSVRMTVNPIRPMRTSVGIAGGSLADGGGSQEPAALVEHGLFDDLVRPQQERLRDCQAKGLRGFE